MKRIGILLALAAILTSMTVGSVLACATRTPGYWKNHAWPVPEVDVGSTTCGEVETMARDGILWTAPKGGNAWIILAQKVIAAKLSMEYDPGDHWANPAYFPTPPGPAFPVGIDNFEDLVGAADALLALYTEASPPPKGSTDRADAIAYAEIIDFWLNYYT